jgi:hypothetical protein
MVVHLRDHDLTVTNFVPQPQTSAFGNFVADSLLSHGEAPIHNPSFLEHDKPNRGDANRLFIVHTTDRNAWVTAQNNAEIQGHVVFVSSTGVVATDLPQSAGPRSYACFWKPSDFADRSKQPRLNQWLQQVQRAKSGEDIDWKLLLPTCIIPQRLAAWVLWKEAEILGMTEGKTRPPTLPDDGDELLKTEFKTLAIEAESATREWDGRELEPVRKLLQLAAGNA